MSDSTTFEDWKKRRADNQKHQAEHHYAIRIPHRGEYLHYTEGTKEYIFEISLLELYGVSIADFIDEFESLETPEFWSVLTRIIAYLTAESKVLYVQCKNEKQCESISKMLVDKKLIDSKCWHISYMDKNFILRWREKDFTPF